MQVKYPQGTVICAALFLNDNLVWLQKTYLNLIRENEFPKTEVKNMDLIKRPDEMKRIDDAVMN